MSCTITGERLQATEAFHGHWCPGLAIGIRAAELALQEFPPEQGHDLVCLSETDMCGVDAIQYLTGCTLGKGNFLQRDYGKMAFSFFDRASGQGFRAVLKPETRADMDDELAGLMRKMADETADSRDRERAAELRQALQERFLNLELESMFSIQRLDQPPPRPPRILTSLACQACGEMTMESRTRRLEGRTFCIPCFEGQEQKR
jgi:formylmethanofuran dehydrogenase subunit E